MSGWLAQWRPALRMARRDLGRHRVRAFLTCLLVALPAVVATVAALAAHNSRYTPDVAASETMGAADGELLVTRFTEVRAKQGLWLSPGAPRHRRGDEPPARRDPSSVDLAALLPEGSELVRSGPAYGGRPLALATGGSAQVHFLELGSPVVAPLADLVAGTAPTGPDDIAVPEYVATELRFLDSSGEPKPDARLELASGDALRVVGVYGTTSTWAGESNAVIASPDSRLAGHGARGHYLVDLPDLSRAELKTLAAELNAEGVAFRPRDAVLHPRAWGLPNENDTGADLTPLVVGAFCVLVGMLEVVLLVGAAFAVAARRQVRDLGLLAANGGAGADVRRVLLGQGLVLGVFSSVVGTSLGVALFLGAHARLESVFGGYTAWRSEIDWRSVVLVALLASTTSVVAALLPSWSISRLTPVAALSGRFPVRQGESHAHRGAFVLGGVGLVLMLAGGWATARSWAPRGHESSLAPAVTALGLLLLLAGAVWMTPWLVRRVAGLGSGLPFSGRYAFRDAGRHRFRSASAVVALAVTVAGAVMASFLVDAAVRRDDAQGGLPAHALELEPPSQGALGPARLAAVRDAVEKVVGPVELVATSQLTARGGNARQLITPGHQSVQTLDRATLQALLGPGQTAVLDAFDAGSLVRLGDGSARAGADTLRVRIDGGGPRPDGKGSWSVPVVDATAANPLAARVAAFGGAFLAEDAARELGVVPRWTSIVAQAGREVTSDDLDRFRVYGLYAWSDDPDVANATRLQWGGLGLAGLVTALVVGVAVALAAAESRNDTATLAAVGAGPGRRRSLGALHGLFLGLVAAGLGGAVGVVAGACLGQVDGLPGVDVPWTATAGTLVVVLSLAPVAGWLVTPSRLDLSRRTA